MKPQASFAQGLSFGVAPISAAMSRVLSHIALLVRSSSEWTKLRRASRNDTLEFAKEVSKTIYHGCDRMGRCGGEIEELLETEHAGDLIESLRMWIEQSVSYATAISQLSRVGTTEMELLAQHSKQVGNLDSKHDDRSRLLAALQYNTCPQTLVASLSHTYGVQSWCFEMLLYLSRHRTLSQPTTVWESMGTCPSKEQLATLLKLTAKIEALHPEQLFTSSVLLLLVRQLSRSLLEPRNQQMLESSSYRKVLWESYDAVVWYECIRGLYALMVQQGGFMPIGMVPPPSRYLWLVSEYGALVLGVDRDIRIHEQFRRAVAHETLLYHGQNAYRDHLFHAINTFLLGHGMLTARNGPFRRICNIRERWNDSSRAILRNWFVAALCHDFGYVLDLLTATLQVCKTFEADAVDKLLATLGERWSVDVAALNRTIETEHKLVSTLGKRPDHGVFSYLHLRTLLRAIDPICRGDDVGATAPATATSEHCKKYKPALSAIMKHNLTSEPLVASKEPLSAILVLCDELQEWVRPRYNTWQLAESILSYINFQQVLEVEPRRVCEAVEVSHCRPTNGRVGFNSGLGSSMARCVLMYADQNANMFDPLTRLLSKIYNLERLECINRVRLIVEIWIPRIKSTSIGRARTSVVELSELAILRDFALLSENGISSSLYSLIGSTPDLRKKCCVYVGEARGKRYDVVCLNLPRFSVWPRCAPLVKKPPWKFEQELWGFKREYCRKRGVACSFLNATDEWPVLQISDAE